MRPKKQNFVAFQNPRYTFTKLIAFCGWHWYVADTPTPFQSFIGLNKVIWIEIKILDMIDKEFVFQYLRGNCSWHLLFTWLLWLTIFFFNFWIIKFGTILSSCKDGIYWYLILGNFCFKLNFVADTTRE